jgi:hypothetical protein
MLNVFTIFLKKDEDRDCAACSGLLKQTKKSPESNALIIQITRASDDLLWRWLQTLCALSTADAADRS